MTDKTLVHTRGATSASTMLMQHNAPNCGLVETDRRAGRQDALPAVRRITANWEIKMVVKESEVVNVETF